jgi:hypothetical protein
MACRCPTYQDHAAAYFFFIRHWNEMFCGKYKVLETVYAEKYR